MEATRRINKNSGDRKARLQALRHKKQQAQHQNKLDLAQDLKNQRIKSLNHKSVEKRLLQAEEQLEQIASVEKGSETEFERKRALEYSINDVSEWHKKKGSKSTKANGSGGYNNYVDLAALSYKRDVAGLEVDLEAYKQQKERVEKQSTQYGYLQPKTDKKDIDKAVEHLHQGNERRRTQSRNTSADGESHHINEKNRQFNLKLNRQYDNNNNNE